MNTPCPCTPLPELPFPALTSQQAPAHPSALCGSLASLAHRAESAPTPLHTALYRVRTFAITLQLVTVSIGLLSMYPPAPREKP